MSPIRLNAPKVRCQKRRKLLLSCLSQGSFAGLAKGPKCPILARVQARNGPPLHYAARTRVLERHKIFGSQLASTILRVHWSTKNLSSSTKRKSPQAADLSVTRRNVHQTFSEWQRTNSNIRFAKNAFYGFLDEWLWRLNSILAADLVG